MIKFVVFIKTDDSKAIPKELVTHTLIKEMKSNGFRKYHTEVEAENEKEAINKLNKNNNEFFNSLSEFSGDVFICSACAVIIALIFFFS